MLNQDKYKTAEERVRAFLTQREVSSIATVIANEFAHWLALEAEEEKPEPCPFCDRPECATTKSAQDVWRKEDGGKTAYYEWLRAASTKGEAK